MALDLTQTPHLNAFLQEFLRPTCEVLRGVLYAGQANIGRLQELMALLAAHPNQDDPLFDGRSVEGVPPMTVGQALIGCQFLAQMLAWTQAPENLDRGTLTLSIFCVRPFPVAR